MLKLKPGDSHPRYPHWKIEQVYHSPAHLGLTKFQWVRSDGVRGTLMGWLGLFDDKQPWLDDNGHSNIGAEFDIKLKDQQITLGPIDLTLMTHRWYSWDAATTWPKLEQAQPMLWS
jgi:hypothetical protein